jgi:PST family polysaccharide transporter
MSDADLPLTLDDVRQRSARSLVVLALRGGAGRLVAMGALVFLSRLLTAADFGAFAILMVPIGLLTLVADAGISGALVQRGEPLSPRWEGTGFALHQGLALALGGLTALAAGPVAAFYELEGTALWALRALALGPFLSGFGLIPSVRLNRSLRFDALAVAEFGSLLLGQGTTLALAAAGGGLWALTAGSLATIAGGSVLVNLLAPWRPRLTLDPGRARRLLRFGLRYQGQGALHLAVAQIIPALGGLWLGSTQVGYLAWAKDISRWPRVPADYVARVGFAAFSRLQGEPAALNRLLQNALLLVGSVTLPLAGLAVALVPRLLVPVFGARWTPAMGPLLIFLLQVPADALATVLLPLIYATGAAGRGLRISLTWAVVAWLSSGLALALTGSLLAIPVAYLFTSTLMAILIVRALPEGLSVSWWPALVRPGLAGLLLGGLVWLVVGGGP